MSLKTVISIFGTIGAGGGITSLALWQTGQLSGVVGNKNSSAVSLASSADSRTDSVAEDRTISPQTLPNTRGLGEGNCKVVNAVGEDIFRGLQINKDEYTTIFCEDTNSEDSEEKIAKNWTGLFPNNLLVNNENLSLKTRFNVKTKTTDGNDGYETTFTGNRFLYPPLIGKWDNDTKVVSNKSITEVKITVEDESDNSQKLYLLFPTRGG